MMITKRKDAVASLLACLFGLPIVLGGLLSEQIKQDLEFVFLI
ncbi:hypothetical protein VPH49_26335 [Pseudomonas luteola]